MSHRARVRRTGYIQTRRIPNSRLLIDPDAAQLDDDGDVQVSWDGVRAVDIITDNLLTCPICLDDPSIPRVFQCGHVYCLPCLQLYKQTSSKCAVCAEWIGAKEMRPCRIQLFEGATAGQLHRFQLVQVNCNITQPCSADEDAVVPTLSSPGWWLSSIVTMTQAELSRLLQRELVEIMRRIADSRFDDESEAVGIYMAKDWLLERLKTLPSVDSPCGYSPFFEISDPGKDAPFQVDTEKTYLYQSATGAPIFLDPLWSRALLIEFAAGRWENCQNLPRDLILPITRTESVPVDEITQRRLRCVSHLPSGFIATLCDVELGDLLSDSTKRALSKSLDKREADKREREQQDIKDEYRKQRYEAKAEKDILKSYGMVRPPVVLPRPEDFVPLPRRSQEAAETSVTVPPSDDTFSFAQIASRPALSQDAAANAQLIDSFLAGKKKGKRTILRIAG